MRWPEIDTEAVVVYIRDYIATHGVPPHMAEISAAVGLSRARTRTALCRLKESGLVKRIPGKRTRRWATPEYTPPPMSIPLESRPQPVMDNRHKRAQWLAMIAAGNA